MAKNETTAAAEERHKNLIAQALNKAGMSGDVIKGFIATATDNITCDTACQKTRQGNLYKQAWQAAKQNLITAPEDVSTAEKNYYVFTKGEQAYKDMLFDQYSDTAAEFNASSRVKHRAYMEKINQMITNYYAITTYAQRMDGLLDTYQQENKKYDKKIDQYIAVVHTSDRKVVYEDMNKSSLKTYRLVLTILYFALLVLYIIFGDYIGQQRYKDVLYWLIIIVYCVLPYFLNWIVTKLFMVGEYSQYLFSIRPHKNAYINL